MPVSHKFASREALHKRAWGHESQEWEAGGCVAGWKETKPGVIYLQKNHGGASPPCAVERKHAQLYI